MNDPAEFVAILKPIAVMGVYIDEGARVLSRLSEKKEVSMTKFGIAAIAAATAIGVAGVAQAGPAISLANGENAAPRTEASAAPVYHDRYGYYHGYNYPRYYHRPYYYRPYYNPYYYGDPGYYNYGPTFRLDIR